MIRKTLILSIFLLISVTVNSQSKKVKRLKSNHIESAILNFNNNMLSIVKWENKDTLQYHIEGKFKYLSKRKWNKFLNEITKLTGISYQKTEIKEEAEIKIFFGEKKNIF